MSDCVGFDGELQGLSRNTKTFPCLELVEKCFLNYESFWNRWVQYDSVMDINCTKTSKEYWDKNQDATYPATDILSVVRFNKTILPILPEIDKLTIKLCHVHVYSWLAHTEWTCSGRATGGKCSLPLTGFEPTSPNLQFKYAYHYTIETCWSWTL